MADNARVRFIRRHGKVIPIRAERGAKAVKRNLTDLEKGGIGLAAGTAVGIGSGKAYNATVRKSGNLKLRATRAIIKLKNYKAKPARDLFHYAKKEQNINKAAGLARNAMRSGRAIGRLAPGFRIGGQIASSSLIGYGAAKVYKSAHKKADGDEVATVATGASTAAFALGTQGRGGIRGAVKDFGVAMSPVAKSFARKASKFYKVKKKVGL